MSSHAVLSFLVWPVSVSLKHVSEELARTDCIRWMFLVRESNLARIQPTYGGHYVSNQTRTHSSGEEWNLCKPSA